MSKKLFSKVFILLLVVGLLFAAAPTKQAQAQTPATLNVAKWSEPVSVGVLGRPSVLVDNGTTHLWVGESDQVLYHYQDGKGELVTFETGKEPIERSSVTVIKEGELYYMVTYSTTVLNFSLYQSSDGIYWEHIDQIFLGESRTGWAKIDAPYLLKDETGYKLYFQMRDVAGRYKIYLATSTILTNRYELAQADPVLTPDDGETRVHHPTVVKDGSQYYMWYASQDQLTIGLAKSTDGINWTKSAANPIINVGFSAEPSVVKVGDTWHMYYMGAGNAIQHVSANGPFEFQTIQAAITAASNGDAIQVAAGSYAENLTINKALTLQGAGRDLVTLTATGGSENGVINISASDVTVEGFKIVANNNKTVRITVATNNVQLKDNHLVGAENTLLANNFTLLETSGNQAGHLITGNIFEANLTSQVVYYNPTTNGITFTGNTFLGTTKPDGVGFVLESLLGTYDISTNNFTGLGGNPYAMMGLPGLTPTAMNTVYGNNTFPTGYAVVGTDIMLPPTKLLMDPATFATTDTCIGTHEVFVKVQAVTNMVSYDLDLTYDSSLITVTNVENVSPIVGTTIPGYSWADGVINFGWYNPSGGGTPPTYTGDYSLIKITFQSNGLAGTSAFTILPSSALEEWPNAFGIPFEITGGASVSFGGIVRNTTPTNPVDYCSLAAAVEAADPGDNLQVLVDFTLPAMVTVNKELTLDLNGKVVTVATGIAALKVDTIAGALTIDDLIGGGTITGGKRAVEVSGGASFTLTNGSLVGTSSDGVFVYGDGSSVTVNGGSITGLYFAISGNANVDGGYGGPTAITINGGTLTSLEAEAIYQPQTGTVTITDGIITGKTGIEIKSGTLTISGGTIEATGAYKADPAPIGGGSFESGDAIFVNSAGYLGDLTVSISGGTFESLNGYALREFVYGTGGTEVTSLSVTGGSFDGGIDANLEDEIYFANEAVTFSSELAVFELPKLSLTGGNYNVDPIEFVFAPNGTYLSGGRWYIALLPVISSTDFDDQVTLGVPTTFELTIDPSVPGTFEMVFTGYPSETQITYGGTTYYCVGSPCVITVPVTLTGASQTLPFAITVATAGTETPALSYSVAATLHAPTYDTTGRDLATLTATVSVTPGFSVSGTVTMQGRTTRAGVPVTLTWVNTLGVTYGPSMDTDEAAANFRLTVNYGGTYTITTLQPRFLNITADLDKTIDVTGDYTFANSLWLRAGNAMWQTADGVYDNRINVNDSTLVLETWGTNGAPTNTALAALDNSGDVNFDGTVSIKDLTLVGGNMYLQSEAPGDILVGDVTLIYAYPDWQP